MPCRPEACGGIDQIEGKAMQTKFTTELRQKRAALLEEAGKFLPDDRRATKEELDQHNAKMEEIKTLTAEIDTREKAAALELEQRAGQKVPQDPINAGSSNDKEAWKAKRDRYAEAYWNSMRYALSESDFRAMSIGAQGKGIRVRTLSNEDRAVLADPEMINAGSAMNYKQYRAMASDPEFRRGIEQRQKEMRDMGIGSPTASYATSVLVPQGFVRDLEVALKYYGGILDAADYIDTSTGQPLPYPTENDTAVSGAQLDENTQVALTTDITVSNLLFQAWKYTTGLIKVSLEITQDAAFDLEGVIRDAMAIRLGRILNTKFTTGAGSTEPKGIITAATAGNTAVGSSGNTGGSETGGTSLGSDDFVDLEHSVDILYRGAGAGYMMHDLTLASVRKVKDKYGRPLWPQLYDGSAKSINGYPIFVNNDMTAIPSVAGAGNKTVAFGQFKKYKIRRVKDLAIMRLVERFADYGQVAFVGFARYDGNLLDAGTHPVKYLTQAAT